jgi:hypothetical protein
MMLLLLMMMMIEKRKGSNSKKDQVQVALPCSTRQRFGNGICRQESGTVAPGAPGAEYFRWNFTGEVSNQLSISIEIHRHCRILQCPMPMATSFFRGRPKQNS